MLWGWVGGGERGKEEGGGLGEEGGKRGRGKRRKRRRSRSSDDRVLQARTFKDLLYRVGRCGGFIRGEEFCDSLYYGAVLHNYRTLYAYSRCV